MATRTHGRSKTPEYRAWRSMLGRCSTLRGMEFKRYGGRGIAACERWRSSFESFFSDMGERPSSEHSIDRIDNNRGYNCGRCADCIARGEGPNCRWATQRVQARNTRRNVWIVVGGERMLATDWAARIGISRQALEQRIASGMPPEKAVTMPRAGRKAA